MQAAADPGEVDGSGRPTLHLPAGQLIRISLYWLGLTVVFSGITAILGGRLKYEGFVPPDQVGTALFQMTVLGTVIAMVVQPTVGTISDYTMSRWGRRKPYILVGSVLDLVFLYAIASSNTVVAIAAFVMLLQFSSNFAQGPFQGYVPDLVPAEQVGVASALVGLFQVLGNVTGFAVGALAIWSNQFFIATIALGLIELTTMVSVVWRVSHGPPAKDRGGRSWLRIAASAWGMDILRERSFLFLVGSRLFVLMAGGLVTNLAVFYLSDSLGLDQQGTGLVQLAVLGCATAGNVIAVVPAARLSDRIGRKVVIYASCAIGAVGLAVLAVAPNVPVALVGAALFGVSGGTFLAVDWALMTDIIPKASSGRYMGISNVATASSGILAVALGGALIMDTVNQAMGLGAGARAAMLFGVACYGIGALLLRPVKEGRREAGTSESPTVAAAASAL
jgi:MFS family permease